MAPRYIHANVIGLRAGVITPSGGYGPIRFRCALRDAPGSMRMAARMWPADVGCPWFCETVH